MVKNLSGGNKTKKISSKRRKRDVLPEDLAVRDKYDIAQITAIHNSSHVTVMTMDKNNLEVFCSRDNNVSRLVKEQYVLIFTPNIEYHHKCKNKKLGERYKSIIVASIDQEVLSTLTKKYKYEFVNNEKKNTDMSMDIVFKEEQNTPEDSGRDDVSEDSIDISLI